MKTSKVKKVLIALDYNPTAKEVAEVGYSLAKTMGAEVTLLHVVSNPLYYSSVEYSPIMGFTGFIDMGPLQPDNVEALKAASKKYLEKSRHHLDDKAIKILIMEGDFAESILEAAKDIHANIIVMGSHSRKWLENIVMGSVTESVLHKSTIPLFIVPTKKHD